MKPLEFKALRARRIKQWVEAGGYGGVVCFSCGNAVQALRDVGLSVPLVAVCPGGDLVAERWWQPEEIRKHWPNYFDATCGHLPLPLIARLALDVRSKGCPAQDVPTGSGETLAVYRLAFPSVQFVPTSDGTAATARHPESTLCKLHALELHNTPDKVIT